MPRSPIIYNLPPGTTPQEPNTPIESAMFNTAMEDIEQTFNTPTPIQFGGTGGTSVVSSSDALNQRGGNIASASTTDLYTATGNIVSITGTTTINSFGNNASLVVGAERTLIFDAALTITHSAAIILPGGVNIVTKQGDILTVRYEGGGNWRCTDFMAYSLPVSDVIGTWTPTLTPQAGAFGSATATGTYTKLADRVLFTMSININNVGTATGSIVVTVPLTSATGITASGGNVNTGLAATGLGVPGTAMTIISTAGGSPIAVGNLILAGQYRV